MSKTCLGFEEWEAPFRDEYQPKMHPEVYARIDFRYGPRENVTRFQEELKSASGRLYRLKKEVEWLELAMQETRQLIRAIAEHSHIEGMSDEQNM